MDSKCTLNKFPNIRRFCKGSAQLESRPVALGMVAMSLSHLWDARPRHSYITCYILVKCCDRILFSKNTDQRAAKSLCALSALSIYMFKCRLYPFMPRTRMHATQAGVPANPRVLCLMSRVKQNLSIHSTTFTDSAHYNPGVARGFLIIGLNHHTYSYSSQNRCTNTLFKSDKLQTHRRQGHFFINKW